MTPTPLDAAAQLRRDDLARSPAYVGPPEAVRFHRDLLNRSDDLDVLMDAAGARALAARLEADIPAHGIGTTHLILHRRRGDPGALAWVQARTPGLLAAARSTPSAMLAADDVALRHHLLDAGLRIQSVTQVGRVDAALQRLPDRARTPLPGGLRWTPMRPDHADAVADLKVGAFADGRFAFFGAGPGFRAQARAAVADPRPFGGRRWMLEDRHGAGGLIELHYRRDDVHNPGGSAGVDIVLAPRLRGAGLLWRCYAHALRTLDEDGVAWLKGATAQPAVMRTGAALGRLPTAVTLRAGAPFDEAWFLRDLPGLAR